MRFEDAVARLATIPDTLPPPSEHLEGTFMDGDDPAEARPSFPDPRPDAVAASVLVLLYPGDDGLAHVVLTERVSRDGHHSGEVSFPGGRAEVDDADEAATALPLDRWRAGRRRSTRCAPNLRTSRAKPNL